MAHVYVFTVSRHVACSCDQACWVTASVIPEGPAKLRTRALTALSELTEWMVLRLSVVIVVVVVMVMVIIFCKKKKKEGN